MKIHSQSLKSSDVTAETPETTMTTTEKVEKKEGLFGFR